MYYEPKSSNGWPHIVAFDLAADVVGFGYDNVERLIAHLVSDQDACGLARIHYQVGGVIRIDICFHGVIQSKSARWALNGELGEAITMVAKLYAMTIKLSDLK
jgi:hypothetical protein